MPLPGDRKRARAPEQSRPPQEVPIVHDVASSSSVHKGRPDGRPNHGVRPLCMNLSILTQARGSAYVESGNTKVVCAVYGPRETLRQKQFSSQGKIECNFECATFSGIRRLGHAQTSDEKDLSLEVARILSQAVRLQNYPKCVIDVYVLVLEDDGSSFASAVTCASIAIANAGIEMYDLPIGCTGGLSKSGEHMVDVCTKEERDCQVLMSCAYLPALDKVCGLKTIGPMGGDAHVEAVATCLGGCKQIHNLVQKTLREEAATPGLEGKKSG